MSEQFTIEQYDELDNPRKNEVLELMLKYNNYFAEYDLSLEEQANTWFVDEDEKEVSGKQAMELYYESLCDHLIVAVNDSGDVVGLRFVEYDEDDDYFRERVSDYEVGLNLTFALVDEDYRRKGIWSRMYEYVKDNLVEEYDVDWLYLATTSENEEMQKAMEKKGFEKVSVEKNERGDGIHALIYRLKVN